ncbi:GDP-L-fucose synthase [Geobacter sp. SVR]|uniref:GDP-L-fucose synthase family protein n=1 Tax=Geobacter sp. SVR TaxID=2495594 RepID=UPI00143EF8A3|nr:GDP-L-fucose synthase [Geobacter sp. SVR]BCS54866.1 GDP-L-fucose synthase [Geobacter sp. SVR]GCF87384.1 GDP-L-fucose synthase [Geobacter sp. SVR]
MDKGAKIFVAGHRGMVGSAIVRTLEAGGFGNLIVRTSRELDLRNQQAVEDFFRAEQPDYVFLAAATVGGIVANSTYPAEFIYDNLQIQTNVIHQAWQTGVKRLLFLGSTCIYPKLAPQPLKEEYLLTGPLEPTNDAYAVAKIAGICQCRSYNRQYGTRFLAAMPNNLYGPNDNFDLEKSHVLPALIRKCHEAKASNAASVTIWGTGTPLREFLHVDDLAEACLFLMKLDEQRYEELLNYPAAPALINVGSGQELSIRDLALLVKRVVGFAGELVFDAGKPDGTPRKLADASRIHALGWRHRIGMEAGIAATYEWWQRSLKVHK